MAVRSRARQLYWYLTSNSRPFGRLSNNANPGCRNGNIGPRGICNIQPRTPEHQGQTLCSAGRLDGGIDEQTKLDLSIQLPSSLLPSALRVNGHGPAFLQWSNGAHCQRWETTMMGEAWRLEIGETRSSHANPCQGRLSGAPRQGSITTIRV